MYTELTDEGRELLERARPTHDDVLENSLSAAQQLPELAPLVDAIHRLPASVG